MPKDRRKRQGSGHDSSRGKQAVGFTSIRKKKTINHYKKILRKEHREDDLYEVIKKQKAEKGGIRTDTYSAINVAAENKRRTAAEEHLKRQQEKEQKIKEREEAQAAAAEKRKQRQKLFSKKTRKGQPYLNNQMTLLLEKIERNVKKENDKNSLPSSSGMS
ncbi:thyroid transcription factor 1-associated protein 26-like [Watersipora subatra]|uniref:thyroid transcription factor 1-associated protein 26-like n=1 Tax=Watersipora subatra TaxID=2589382 RepID=UPI00355C4576